MLGILKRKAVGSQWANLWAVTLAVFAMACTADQTNQTKSEGYFTGKPGYDWRWVHRPKEKAEFAIFDTEEAPKGEEEIKKKTQKPLTPPYYRPGLPSRP